MRRASFSFTPWGKKGGREVETSPFPLTTQPPPHPPHPHPPPLLPLVLGKAKGIPTNERKTSDCRLTQHDVAYQLTHHILLHQYHLHQTVITFTVHDLRPQSYAVPFAHAKQWERKAVYCGFLNEIILPSRSLGHLRWALQISQPET